MAETDIVAPAVTLLVAGQELDAELMANLISVEVVEELNQPDACHIGYGVQRIDDGGDEGLDLAPFTPGASLVVKLGMGQPQTLMTGDVSAIEPDLGASSAMLVTAYDRLHRMRFGRRSRSFLNASIADIARTMAGESGLGVDQIDDTGPTYDAYLQYDQSDYDFLMEQRERLHFVLAGRQGALAFRSLRVDGPSIATLTFELDLTSLWLRLRALTAGSPMTVRSWDVVHGTVISASDSRSGSAMGGSSDGFAVSGRIAAAPETASGLLVVDQQQAAQFAAALREERLDGFIEGEGETMGNPALQPGVNITLAGLGDEFSGLYLVTAANHRYATAGGYTTRFRVLRTGI